MRVHPFSSPVPCPRRLSIFPVLLAALLAGCFEGGPAGPELERPESPEGPVFSRAAGAEIPGTRVLSRNLYLGADIGPLLDPTVDPAQAAAQIWAEIQHTSYPDRAARLAAEIARLEPHLVGLQEVTRFTIGPFPSQEFPEPILLDFLDVLQAHLEALGQDYAVAVRQPNTQAMVPVFVEGQLVTIGYQDGDAILVRADVDTANPLGVHFAARPPLEFTAGIPFVRGWTQVDARVGNGWVRFVNTHLEIQSFAAVQVLQTQELLGALAISPHPVILLGDFNSAANPSAPPDRKTASYGMILASGFVDLWTRMNDPDDGLTCCHQPDLSNETAAFDQRLDLIFARNVPGKAGGFAGAAFLELVGDSPGDRFITEGLVGLWPSDHAGVAGTLRLPAGLLAAP